MTINATGTAMTGTGTPLARPRALGMVPASALASWPVTSPAAGTSYRRSDLARPAHLNSIVRSDVVVPAPADRDGFGAAKQADPPRGVPR